MFREVLKIEDFKILGICSYGMHIFYFIFVQFMQFPVLYFGLAHSGSRPFMSCLLAVVARLLAFLIRMKDEVEWMLVQEKCRKSQEEEAIHVATCSYITKLGTVPSGHSDSSCIVHLYGNSGAELVLKLVITENYFRK